MAGGIAVCHPFPRASFAPWRASWAASLGEALWCRAAAAADAAAGVALLLVAAYGAVNGRCGGAGLQTLGYRV